MSDELFGRLAPFIKEYIYQNGWSALRPIQADACRAVFDTESHILISAGTATGKTEAAFLPVLTELYNNPSSSIGVLYIAPMKALINDQFLRIGELLKEGAIPVHYWHGDVAASKKQQVIKKPEGVLQITPESLESMLINRTRDILRLFCDLRFVVIDEVHAFMGSDRGIQVLCLIERLQRFIGTEPRRIGLSATLGDYSAAADWLGSGGKRTVMVLRDDPGGQKIRLAVEHFMMPVIEGVDMKPEDDPSWQYLYEKTLGRKAIIFGNGRQDPEAIITSLKRVALSNGTPDCYYTHHGSIAAPLREDAETALKEKDGPVVVSATVTMEMGIDIGRLERVLQCGPPVSVASLVQRLGRSGRRGNPPEMWFLDWEMDQGKDAPLPYQIPWRLIQIIAMIQLYIEERWIEPPKILKYPMSMLYHQTMSMVAASGELSPQGLCARLMSLSRFSAVTMEDIRILINSLLEQGHLELTEGGGLILGLQGAKVTDSFKFYAVFPDEEEWAVMQDSRKIGTIEDPVPPGEYVTVGGQCWLVSSVDRDRRAVFVKPTKLLTQYFWHGDRAIIHNRILKRMRQVLCESTIYPYLQEKAVERLNEGRRVARMLELDKYNVYDAGDGVISIYPWIGHIDYHLIKQILQKYCKNSVVIKSVQGMHPYFMTIRTSHGNAKAVFDEIKRIFSGPLRTEDFIKFHEIRSMKKELEYKVPKYDCYIPDELLLKQIKFDYADIDEIKNEVNSWRLKE